MRLTVLGATGGTGQAVVREALARGHTVTAAVRNPDKIRATHERLRVVRTDIFDAASLEPAVDGADAVLSSLGWSDVKNTPPTCSTSIRSILRAMRAGRTSRIIVVSAAPVLRSGAGESLAMRLTALPLIRAVYRREYGDLEAMEEILADSDVDWTVFRPGWLVDEAGAGYRTAVDANVPGRMRREDLAAAMIDLVEDKDSYRTSLGIASG